VSASLDGKLLGAPTPAAAPTTGYIAVGTQSAEAAFDDVVVSKP
jgi:hypothetical protein